MHLADADQLKSWVIKKLEDISEADPDILADYAIALVGADAPESSLKQNTLDSLKDFLGTRADSFVDEFFAEINKNARAQNSIPSTTQPDPTVPPSFASDIDTSKIHPARTGHISIASERASNQSRKRTWQDSQGPLDIPTGPRRQAKLNKRAGARSTTHVSSNSHGFTQLHPLSYANSPAPGPQTKRHAQAQLANIDPMTAMNAMITMTQMLGLPPPDLSQLGHTLSQAPPCADYHQTGQCERGLFCQYSHQALDGEYDPTNSTSVAATPIPSFFRKTNSQTGGTRGARNSRAPFSMLGPSFDRSNTRIVVEQIPEDNFDEGQVRTFFEAFGSIEDVDMQPYKRLAVVRYADHSSAQAAFNSPKVIFDNRFVKVYWYNSDTIPQSKASGFHAPPKVDEPEFDRAKFEEQNAEAQRKHEARLEARSAAQATAAEIEEKRTALMAEYSEIKEKLEARGIEMHADVDIKIDANGKKKHHDTDALKAQLAQLEAEARDMGIDVEAMDEDESYAGGFSHRGRGGFRGRYRGRATRGYRGRGGFGSWSTRGAPRGAKTVNGLYRGSVQANGRYNLDLRPRRVKVVLLDENTDWEPAKEEALREHLFSIGEFTIEPVTESGDAETDSDQNRAIVVSFKDRPTAECFYYGPRYMPDVGKIDCDWIANLPSDNTTMIIENGDDDEEDEDDTAMGNAPVDRTSGNATNGPSASRGLAEDDYDVAEEDERWVVT